MRKVKMQMLAQLVRRQPQVQSSVPVWEWFSKKNLTGFLPSSFYFILKNMPEKLRLIVYTSHLSMHGNYSIAPYHNVVNVCLLIKYLLTYILFNRNFKIWIRNISLLFYTSLLLNSWTNKYKTRNVSFNIYIQVLYFQGNCKWNM